MNNIHTIQSKYFNRMEKKSYNDNIDYMDKNPEYSKYAQEFYNWIISKETDIKNLKIFDNNAIFNIDGKYNRKWFTIFNSLFKNQTFFQMFSDMLDRLIYIDDGNCKHIISSIIILRKEKLYEIIVKF